MSDPYNEVVRAYFAEPRHAGDVAGGAVGEAVGADVGIRLSAVARSGVVGACRFRARGCPHLIAAAEAVCRALEGRNPVEIGQISVAEVCEPLAVPLEKTGRILVLEDAVRELGQRLRDAS